MLVQLVGVALGEDHELPHNWRRRGRPASRPMHKHRRSHQGHGPWGPSRAGAGSGSNSNVVAIAGPPPPSPPRGFPPRREARLGSHPSSSPSCGADAPLRSRTRSGRPRRKRPARRAQTSTTDAPSAPTTPRNLWRPRGQMPLPRSAPWRLRADTQQGAAIASNRDSPLKPPIRRPENRRAKQCARSSVPCLHALHALHTHCMHYIHYTQYAHDMRNTHYTHDTHSAHCMQCVHGAQTNNRPNIQTH